MPGDESFQAVESNLRLGEDGSDPPIICAYLGGVASLLEEPPKMAEGLSRFGACCSDREPSDRQ